MTLNTRPHPLFIRPHFYPRKSDFLTIQIFSVVVDCRYESGSSAVGSDAEDDDDEEKDEDEEGAENDDDEAETEASPRPKRRKVEPSSDIVEKAQDEDEDEDEDNDNNNDANVGCDAEFKPPKGVPEVTEQTGETKA
jgi:hypothetical protein